MNINNIAKVDLNLLKSLRALLEELHVGRAAQKMNVTQPAMSHTLVRLRDTFSDPLFIRHAKGLEPTARALELADKLQLILHEIDSLLAPKTLEPSLIHARFRIQTHDFIVGSYLSNAIRTIRAEAPNIIIDVKILNESAYDNIDSGNVDMIIGAGLKANPRFMQKRLADEALVCLLDKHNPVLNNWCAEAIFAYPHIKSSLVDEQDDPVSQYAKVMKLPERKIGIYAETLNLQLGLLPDTRLIAFLPESIAQQGKQLYGLTVKTCPFDLPDITIRGMWHERHQNDLIHQWIRNKISDSFVSIN